jgi:hypothetical protein
VSEVPVWTCEFAGVADDKGMDHLTVGDRFRMSCHGDIAVAWSADVPRVQMPKPEQDFTLAVLSAEKLDPHAVQLTVTGYRPGDHAPEYVRILQGDKGFETEKPKWKIESILQPSEKPPSPFPSEGYFSVLPPLWFVVVLLLTIIAAIVGAILWGVRWYRGHQFKAELRSHQTALPPVRQFYRDSRALRRRLNQAGPSELPTVVADLNREVRKLLLRHFEIPALTYSDAATVKAITRRHGRESAGYAPLLRKTLRELTRALTNASVNAADVDQLIRMSVDLAESLERSSK